MRLIAYILSQNWLKYDNNKPAVYNNSKARMENPLEQDPDSIKKFLDDDPSLTIRYVYLSSPHSNNNSNRPDPFEQKSLEILKENENETEYVKVDKIKAKKAIRYLKPLRQKDLIGAISLTLPIEYLAGSLWNITEKSLLIQIGLIGLMILIWMIFAKLVIIDRLKELSRDMMTIIKEESPQREILTNHKDEISQLFSIFKLTKKILNQKIQSLAKKMDLYESLVGSARYGILALDRDGKILFLNEGAEKIFGWEKEEILAQNINLLIPPKLRQNHNQSIELYLEKNSKSEYYYEKSDQVIETCALRKNGEEFPLHISISWGKAGENKILVAIIQDITEQKRKEEEVIKENEKLALLNHVSTELILQRDLKKLAEYSLYESLELTDSLCGLFLLLNENGDLIPMDMLGLTNPNDEAIQIFKPNGILGEIIIQKEPRIINTSVKRINRSVLSFGRFSFFSFMGVPIISNQEVIGVICVANKPEGYTEKEQNLLTTLANDISLLIVRNAVEKEIQILEEKFRTLFDQSSEMIVICSMEGKILTVNPKVIQATGFPYQELIDYALWKLYLPSEERKTREFLKYVSEKKAGRLESLIRQKNGNPFPVDMQANTVTFNDQKVVQIVIRDIIHLKQEEKNVETRLKSFMVKLDEYRKELVFFRKAVNNLPEYVFFTDQRGRVFFTNRAFNQRFIYTNEELIGKSFEVLFPPAVSLETIDKIIDQALEGIWKGKTAFVTKEDQLVNIEFNLRAIHGQKGGGVSGLLGIATENNQL